MKRLAIHLGWAVLLIAAAGCAQYDSWNRYAQAPGSTAVDAAGGARGARENYTLIPPGVR